ncbi:hypothetical protein E2C01_039712 [Portunus trituberculatus]|uniref:Uncharacterized protein n=1 Tax=Portunus trituberculatus TaxID=210409 RepID=A0A5B7FNQ9_PORTR|nr:hypothetical protein [Portunus trituberculatus]
MDLQKEGSAKGHLEQRHCLPGPDLTNWREGHRTTETYALPPRHHHHHHHHHHHQRPSDRSLSDHATTITPAVHLPCYTYHNLI